MVLVTADGADVAKLNSAQRRGAGLCSSAHWGMGRLQCAALWQSGSPLSYTPDDWLPLVERGAAAQHWQANDATLDAAFFAALAARPHEHPPKLRARP